MEWYSHKACQIKEATKNDTNKQGSEQTIKKNPRPTKQTKNPKHCIFTYPGHFRDQSPLRYLMK